MANHPPSVGLEEHLDPFRVVDAIVQVRGLRLRHAGFPASEIGNTCRPYLLHVVNGSEHPATSRLVGARFGKGVTQLPERTIEEAAETGLVRQPVPIHRPSCPGGCLVARHVHERMFSWRGCPRTNGTCPKLPDFSQTRGAPRRAAAWYFSFLKPVCQLDPSVGIGAPRGVSSDAGPRTGLSPASTRHRSPEPSRERIHAGERGPAAGRSPISTLLPKNQLSSRLLTNREAGRRMGNAAFRHRSSAEQPVR